MSTFEQSTLRTGQAKISGKGVQIRKTGPVPVERLPFDVLAIIFLEYSMDDWKTPICLASVCRDWQRTVLALPRLWSCISLPCAPQLTSLFLERRGKCLLHIILSTEDDKSFDTVARYKDEIQCLNIPSFPPQLAGKLFPRIEHLSMRGYRPGSLCRSLGIDFPKLRQLKLPNLVLGEAETPVTAGISKLPSLDTLVLSLRAGPSLSLALKNWGETVTCLNLILVGRVTFTQSYTVALPNLEALDLRDYREEHETQQVELMTPRLQTFHAYIYYNTKSYRFLTDPSNITHMRLTGHSPPALSSHPHLKSLSINIPRDDFIRYLQELLSDASLCPVLETINYDHRGEGISFTEHAKFLVTEINLQNRHNIKLLHCDRWHVELAGLEVLEIPVRRSLSRILKSLNTLLVWDGDALFLR